MPLTPDSEGWPAHLRAGAIRFARSSRSYGAAVAFYRDLIGLPVLDTFADSYGEDGTIFGLPDEAVQLELVRHRPRGDADVDQLVVYLDGDPAVDEATAAVRAAGLPVDVAAQPYWAANGAVVVRDPDDREVLLAPWVYGRDPEPAEHVASPGPAVVAWHDGDRAELLPLFREAEDSDEQLADYLEAGDVLVARVDGQVVGHLQLVPAKDGAVELKNMAVAAEQRGGGIGRLLVEAARDVARERGSMRMLVATAAADVGNLRFYQRCGFRMHTVERDAFTPETGYPDPVVIDGILLRDRVWLELLLDDGAGA